MHICVAKSDIFAQNGVVSIYLRTCPQTKVFISLHLTFIISRARDRDKLESDRDKLESERDKLESERDKLESDRDKLESDRDKLESDL